MLNLENHVLVGDFNAKSATWGEQKRNKFGELLENTTLDTDYIIINTGDTTRIPLHNKQKPTAIDLTLISNNFQYEAIHWKALEDSLGSDHFPCKTTLIGNGRETDKETLPLRFNTKKADWQEFKHALMQVKPIVDDNVDNFCSKILEEISKAALATIPNNQNNLKRKKREGEKYWWNEECEQAVQERRSALKKILKNNTKENQDTYRIKRNKATAIIRLTKRKAWQEFINNINTRDNPKAAWNQMNRIRGKKKNHENSRPIEDIATNKKAVTNQEKAELLGKQFAHISSDNNLEPSFKEQKDRTKEENKVLYKGTDTRPRTNQPTHLLQRTTKHPR
ncbi:RNA-directed DNA polymerase from mobile element jockey [Elysia marginata]|uniref:RNA-directed DNA polymerase from mobile element jockey n=1 Tax=Elysia marginata TaxID=1093978 RepID=A0AAV4JRB8_9GAST|nr:RNA-directed DNA polymerase from mobile element jockey [Elysia marginata]